jgi:hypothetical protein
MPFAPTQTFAPKAQAAKERRDRVALSPNGGLNTKGLRFCLGFNLKPASAGFVCVARHFKGWDFGSALGLILNPPPRVLFV